MENSNLQSRRVLVQFLVAWGKELRALVTLKGQFGELLQEHEVKALSTLVRLWRERLEELINETDVSWRPGEEKIYGVELAKTRDLVVLEQELL